MKSMYEQKKEIFARHADIKDGKYISKEKAVQLLGKDAVRYAINAVKGYSNMAAYRNFCDGVEVLTFDGFLNAFSFFHMMEIKKGLYNAWQTPDIFRKMYDRSNKDFSE